jgi:hypothetical protein
VTDESVNKNHGILKGITPYTWLTNGMFFDGKSIYSKTTHALDWPRLVTIEIWARSYERYNRR